MGFQFHWLTPLLDKSRFGLTYPPQVLLYLRRHSLLQPIAVVDLAAVPLPETEIFCFFALELLYGKLRYLLSKFNAVSSLFICSASGSPTAATSSLPTRALGIY